MARAYVLINVETGLEKNVVDKLKTLKNMKEAYFVFGVYDVIAVIDAPTVDELKHTIHQEMRQVEGIRSTCTMIVIK